MYSLASSGTSLLKTVSKSVLTVGSAFSLIVNPAEVCWINKFKIPFVCGATNLGEALRRISEGAAMIRTKGEAGTGNVVEGFD